VRRALRQETWAAEPFLDRVLAAYARETGRVTDPAALLVCPNCGADVFPNVRVGPEFVDGAHRPAGDGPPRWLGDAPGTARLLVLEIGAGVQHPRRHPWPTANVVRHTPGARLVRVNPDHPEVPADLGDRALAVPFGADLLLGTLAA
jgi:hypothetical protein